VKDTNKYPKPPPGWDFNAEHGIYTRTHDEAVVWREPRDLCWYFSLGSCEQCATDDFALAIKLAEYWEDSESLREFEELLSEEDGEP
jgi:hypothetical protein